MKIKSFSNPLAVVATLLIFVFVMFIVMTATTEADTGFQQSESEQTGMREYYDRCPFKKAEKADLMNSDSIRQYVKFTDVSCDSGTQEEQVTVEFLGENKDESKVKFEQWLQNNGLEEGDRLQISFVK